MDRKLTEQSNAVQPTRRQVLGAGLSVAAIASVLPSAAAAAVAQPSLARSTDIGAGWKFALVNAADITDPTGAFADAHDPAFDDSGWRAVDLPHDWSIELAPVPDGGTSSATGFFQGGLGWYRKTFTLPRSTANRRISVRFDGVYSNAFVYVNGQLLGNHPYAYTGFSFDLTGLVHTDGVTPNVLAVRAQNQLPSSRWYSGSGIYRNVHLVVTDPVHVARHGTFATTPNLAGTLAAGYATVQVATSVANDGSGQVDGSVRTSVVDAAGRVVASAVGAFSVAGGQSFGVSTAMRVVRPVLWSTDRPQLYGLRTDVVVGGRVVDSTVTSIGFRYAVFDPAEGFSLNGRPMKIQGVDLHATQGPLGAVINVDALTRQLRIMKDMGANALRTAHNPPAPELIAVCERLGILLLVEAFDCWHSGKVAYDYHIYFDQWSRSDITEMVLAARNSPAVVVWSIGNETPDTWMPGGPPIARRLIDAVRAADPTRPIVMGSDQYRFVPATGSPQDQILSMLDGLGLNYNTAMSLDGLHAKYPDKFFFESESSSETSSRGTYQSPELLNTGENYTPGRRATSSYDNNLASWTMSDEYGLKKDRDRRFFQGQFLWSGQDYIGEPTPYDVFPVKSSFFGAVDTAGFPKDAYHFFRSQWTTEPMVHIVPMDWTRHSVGESVEVWAYSSVDTVELSLNGRSLGVRSFDRKVTVDGRPYRETTEPTGDDKNYPSGSYTSPNGSTGKLHLTWSVPFEPGRLVAVARSGNRVVARDELNTAGPARAVVLTADRRGMPADGALSFVSAAVVDSRGVVVPGADHVIRFGLTGPGRLAGVDNGRQESAQGYAVSSVPAFRGLAVAVVAAAGRPGTIVVTASADGLVSSRVSVLVSGSGDRLHGAVPGDVAPLASPAADAGFSGAPDTLPAAMLDGDPGTGWSNYYVKSATATLPAVSVSPASDWVSVSFAPRSVSGVVLDFVVGGPLALPAALGVEWFDGRVFRPVRDPSVALGTSTSVSFDPVVTSRLRLTLASPFPGTSGGFFRVTSLVVSETR